MSLNTGVRTGDYEPISILGSGACAEVWLADKIGHGDFRRRVAIKVLKDDRREDIAMFEALQLEARICAQLTHPNIVQVFSVENLGDNMAVVMEYVSGGTLKEFVQRSLRLEMPLPTSIILSLARDIARGLAYAHSSPGELTGPVIHRDLKPANILLDESSTARIADFGIAKVIGEATSTEAGVFKGTPAYSAPEVWEDERNFSPATDLFSLGCILYELVMLKRLFGARSVPAIFGKIAKGDPREEAQEIAGRLPDLVPTLERLLQRDPARRLASADELVTILDLLINSTSEAPAPWLYEELVVALEEPTDDENGEERRRPSLPPSLPDEWLLLAARALPIEDPKDDDQPLIANAETWIVTEENAMGASSPKPALPASPVEFLPEGNTVHFGPTREDSEDVLPFSATVTAGLLFALLALIIMLTTVDCT